MRRQRGDPGGVLTRLFSDPDELEILNLGCSSLEERTDSRTVGGVGIEMDVPGVGTAGFLARVGGWVMVPFIRMLGVWGR